MKTVMNVLTYGAIVGASMYGGYLLGSSSKKKRNNHSSNNMSNK